MPTRVTDAEGNEVDALTAEEVDALQKRANQAEEFEKKVAEQQKELDLAKQESNPNWREARAKMDKLQGFIKEKGFELNDDGTVKDSQQVNPDELRDKIKGELKEETFKENRDELLDEYDDQTKPIIDKYVSKLMSGEEQNLKNLKNAFKEAEKLAGVGEEQKRSGSINGQPPKFNSDGKSFSDTEEGKEMAKQLFGEESFTNKK